MVFLFVRRNKIKSKISKIAKIGCTLNRKIGFRVVWMFQPCKFPNQYQKWWLLTYSSFPESTPIMRNGGKNMGQNWPNFVKFLLSFLVTGVHSGNELYVKSHHFWYLLGNLHGWSIQITLNLIFRFSVHPILAIFEIFDFILFLLTKRKPTVQLVF